MYLVKIRAKIMKNNYILRACTYIRGVYRCKNEGLTKSLVKFLRSCCLIFLAVLMSVSLYCLTNQHLEVSVSISDSPPKCLNVPFATFYSIHVYPILHSFFINTFY